MILVIHSFPFSCVDEGEDAFGSDISFLYSCLRMHPLNGQFELPSFIKTTPYPHQHLALCWMLSREGRAVSQEEEDRIAKSSSAIHPLFVHLHDNPKYFFAPRTFYMTDVPMTHLVQRQVPVLFYTYVVDGQEYVDDMGRDPEALPRFYRFLQEGKLPQTSQINVATYVEFFEQQLQKGDLLHIAFTSGQSGSVNNAYIAAETLREKYPERKIQVIDSLCSSSGYGLLVDEAADLRDAGRSLEETAQWVLANRNKVHHQFFSSDMTQFRRTGRVSGAAAMVATVLNICPIMRLNDEGRIIAYDKVRGKKKAVAVTVENMLQHAQNGADYAGRCYICNSDCPEDAKLLTDAIGEKFPNLRGKIVQCDIGTIIGSHAGKGTVAVFFMGDERPHME